ncbi:PREDICTED: somatostatin receptor type 2-like [Rhagoletis zephyria]|uniref:somatostatin receptor type 2-like n=1 Tax=Rhagoletis zephyria TaxID=28612 RepID=UPI0008116FD4|nr:PREDICTED: somatostatin receptor type 2-like [Rhagoletis zephyria]XP_017473162.1 PREDICTED: somatostatin receptor type 2-like [Rhagoletis zephyria]
MWRPPSNGVTLIIFSGILLVFNFIQTAGEATARMAADVSEKSEKDTTEIAVTMRSTTVSATRVVSATVAANKSDTTKSPKHNSQQVWSSLRPAETTPNSTRTIGTQARMNRTYTLPRGFQRAGHRRTFYEHCMDHRNSFADLATLVLYSLVCLVGLFGNTLVIYVVLRFSKMQTVTNIYILNLAIADECFLIGIPFLLYTMRICSWRFGDFMCKAYMVSTSITQFTSSIFLLIMSADRYLAVCHPIASPKYRTQRIAKIVSAIAWLTSVVLMLPVILYASTVIQEDGVNLSCNIEWPETYKKHSATTFTLYTFFLGFATPLCFILCFYYLVIRKLHAVGSKHKSKEKKRSHRKVTRLVLTVITVYILCWLPYWISQVTLINSNPMQNQLSRLEILIFLLLFCLVYSNSAMNPILYAFLSDNFRKSFFKAFTCITKNEVNAQLQAEPSLLTKQGNGKRRQKRQSNAKLNEPNLVAATSANNNSSVTTSSTTTAPVGGDKVTPVLLATTTVSTDGSASTVQPNGRPPVRSDAFEGEDMILVMEHERPMCALLERENVVGNVLQTDL